MKIIATLVGGCFELGRGGGSHSVRCTAGATARSLLTWGGDRLSGEEHVEGRLFTDGRRVGPSADEEAGSAAEEHPHHQQQPDGEGRRLGDLGGCRMRALP